MVELGFLLLCECRHLQPTTQEHTRELPALWHPPVSKPSTTAPHLCHTRTGTVLCNRTRCTRPLANDTLQHRLVPCLAERNQARTPRSAAPEVVRAGAGQAVYYTAGREGGWRTSNAWRDDTRTESRAAAGKSPTRGTRRVECGCRSPIVPLQGAGQLTVWETLGAPHGVPPGCRSHLAHAGCSLHRTTCQHFELACTCNTHHTVSTRHTPPGHQRCVRTRATAAQPTPQRRRRHLH